MSNEIVLISEAHDQQARLSGRPLATLNERELFELIIIMYHEFSHDFMTTTDWKDKILKDRAEALDDKLDSFAQDLDPSES